MQIIRPPCVLLNFISMKGSLFKGTQFIHALVSARSAEQCVVFHYEPQQKLYFHQKIDERTWSASCPFWLFLFCNIYSINTNLFINQWYSIYKRKKTTQLLNINILQLCFPEKKVMPKVIHILKIMDNNQWKHWTMDILTWY